MQPGPTWCLLVPPRVASSCAFCLGQLYGLGSRRTCWTQPIFFPQVLRTTGPLQPPSSSLSCCCCSASPAVAVEPAQQMLETGIFLYFATFNANPCLPRPFTPISPVQGGRAG